MRQFTQNDPLIPDWLVRIFLTPVLFCLLFLISVTSLLPVFENQFSESEIRLISALLSFLCTTLFLWGSSIKQRVLHLWMDQDKLENIAQIIFRSSLSFDEAEVINSTEGWDCGGIVAERITDDELKLAFDLAKRKERGEEIFGQRTLFIMMITSFLMAPFGFSGLLHWKSDVGAIFSGVFCLCSGFLLLYSYIRSRR